MKCKSELDISVAQMSAFTGSKHATSNGLNTLRMN